MENDMTPLIITIAIASVVIVGSNIATFVILLNHLSGRIDRSEARVTETMRSDKAELQETIRDSERRMSHRMDRFEDKTDANFEVLRRERLEREVEQPIVGDD